MFKLPKSLFLSLFSYFLVVFLLPVFSLSHSTVSLSYCSTDLPFHRPTVIPSHQHTDPPSYCPTVIPILVPPAFAASEQTYFLHQDHLGSIIVVTNESGEVVSQEKYSPYGGTANAGIQEYMNTGKIERGYTGQIQDMNTALQYYNARYYDPVLARFISPDSINDQQNRYAYVAGNPVLRNDPSGNQGCDPDDYACRHKETLHPENLPPYYPFSEEYVQSLITTAKVAYALGDVGQKALKPAMFVGGVIGGLSCPASFGLGCGVAFATLGGGGLYAAETGDTSPLQVQSIGAGVGQVVGATAQGIQSGWQYLSSRISLSQSKSFNALKGFSNLDESLTTTNKVKLAETGEWVDETYSYPHVVRSKVSSKNPVDVAADIAKWGSRNITNQSKVFGRALSPHNAWEAAYCGTANCVDTTNLTIKILGEQGVQAQAINVSNNIFPHFATLLPNLGKIVMYGGRVHSADAVLKWLNMGGGAGFSP